MAESSLCSESSEPEISSLRQALRAHQKLLKKLHGELEEEREASATAASEALSVILRIQGEKAAVKMEANQYKRIAEEKMCHLEESVAIFEDLICQKQLEIAALEFQVLSYRCRLPSFGFSDLGVHDKLRIVKSLPPVQLKDSYLKNNSLEMEKVLLPISDFVPNIVEEAAELEDYDRIYSLEKKSRERQNEFDYDFDEVNVYENQDSSSLSEIQDVYEVPLAKKAPLANKACKSYDQSKSIAKGERRLEKPNVVYDEICLANFRVKGEKRRKKKLLLPRKHENIKLRSKESKIVKGYVAPIVVKSSDGEARSEIGQLCHRIEQLEVEKCGRRQGVSEEELKLLREIHEKLDFIQSEITNRRPKKSSRHLESTLLTLTERLDFMDRQCCISGCDKHWKPSSMNTMHSDQEEKSSQCLNFNDEANKFNQGLIMLKHKWKTEHQSRRLSKYSKFYQNLTPKAYLDIYKVFPTLKPNTLFINIVVDSSRFLERGGASKSNIICYVNQIHFKGHCFFQRGPMDEGSPKPIVVVGDRSFLSKWRAFLYSSPKPNITICMHF